MALEFEHLDHYAARARSFGRRSEDLSSLTSDGFDTLDHYADEPNKVPDSLELGVSFAIDVEPALHPDITYLPMKSITWSAVVKCDRSLDKLLKILNFIDVMPGVKKIYNLKWSPSIGVGNY